MVNRADLVEGKEYRVIDNVGGHEFSIGEIVRFVCIDSDNELVCEHLDKHDYWYMYHEELEEV